MHVAWFLCKQQRREYLLHDGAHSRERQANGAAAPPLALDVRVGHCCQDDVVLPAGIAASFEMIEPKFALEFLILLLDRPSLMRERDQGAQRLICRQMDEVVLEPAR